MRHKSLIAISSAIAKLCVVFGDAVRRTSASNFPSLTPTHIGHQRHFGGLGCSRLTLMQLDSSELPRRAAASKVERP